MLWPLMEGKAYQQNLGAVDTKPRETVTWIKKEIQVDGKSAKNFVIFGFFEKVKEGRNN